MHASRSLWLPAALIAAALALPARTARAQSCTIPDTLQIAVTGNITYANGARQPLEGSITQARNQSSACGRGTGTITGGCTLGATPIGRLIAAKILQIVDKRAQIFDLACGAVSGTLTLGQAPFAQGTGTFLIQRVQSSFVQAQIDMFVPGDPSLASLFTGEMNSSERLEPNGAGKAKGAGTINAKTALGVTEFPFVATYELIGNRSASLGGPLIITQALAYNCASGAVASDVCIAPAVPSGSPVTSVALALCLVGVGTFALSRRRRRN